MPFLYNNKSSYNNSYEDVKEDKLEKVSFTRFEFQLLRNTETPVTSV